MTDQPDHPELPPEEGPDGLLPWEDDPPPEEEFGPDGRRIRHDAFTERRKHNFLKALAKTGCLEDACRATGVGRRTVYRHQDDDPQFAEHVRLALRMAATPLELTAWQRAVEGVEQPFACGGEVHVRRRYDSGLLRLLLQGSNPKKYGARPGFSRKRLLKHERDRLEREIRAEIAAKAPTFDESIVMLEKSLMPLVERDDADKLAAGWTRSPQGDMVPPGYAPIPGWTPPEGWVDRHSRAAAGWRVTGEGAPRDGV